MKFLIYLSIFCISAFSQKMSEEDRMIHKYSKGRFSQGVNLFKKAPEEKKPFLINTKNKNNEIIINPKANKNDGITFIDLNKEATDKNAISDLIEELKNRKKEKKVKVNAKLKIRAELINLMSHSKKTLKNYYLETLDSKETFDPNAVGELDLGFTLKSKNSQRSYLVKSFEGLPLNIKLSIEKGKSKKITIPVLDLISFRKFLEEYDLNYEIGYMFLELKDENISRLSLESKEKCRFYFNKRLKKTSNIKNAKYALICLKNGLRTSKIEKNKDQINFNTFISEDSVTYIPFETKKKSIHTVAKFHDGSYLNTQEKSFLNWLTRKKPIKKGLNIYSFENSNYIKNEKYKFYLFDGKNRIKISQWPQRINEVTLTSREQYTKILKKMEVKWNKLSCLVEVDVKKGLEFIEYGLQAKLSTRKDDLRIEQLEAVFLAVDQFGINKELSRNSSKFYYYFEGLGELHLKLNYDDFSSDYINANCLNERIIENL